MGRHYSLLGKRPTSMPLDDGAVRTDSVVPRTAAFRCSSSERRRILVVHLSSLVEGRLGARSLEKAEVELDHHACEPRYRIAWRSKRLAAGPRLTAQIRPERQRGPLRLGCTNRTHRGARSSRRAASLEDFRNHRGQLVRRLSCGARPQQEPASPSSALMLSDLDAEPLSPAPVRRAAVVGIPWSSGSATKCERAGYRRSSSAALVA
jgi:hypothetical protein